MKNFFCVGQKVIEAFHNRALVTITKILDSGQIELDSGHIVYPDRVQVQQEFLDPTNYFYHHASFSKGQDMANTGFSDLLFILEEKAELTKWEKETGNERPRFQAFLSDKQVEAESMIEKGLMIKRTAEHNLNQWSSGETGYVIAQHMPFLNPEKCPDYYKEH